MLVAVGFCPRHMLRLVVRTNGARGRWVLPKTNVAVGSENKRLVVSSLYKYWTAAT